jgi:hypothetical protein
MEGASPHRFRPMYAEANMGHPSREGGSFVSVNSSGDELFQTQGGQLVCEYEFIRG